MCVIGSETTFLSCNNMIFQNQKNTGNNTLAQHDDDDEDEDENGGNSAKQSSSRLQSS
jgi:hypothetical protein